MTKTSLKLALAFASVLSLQTVATKEIPPGFDFDETVPNTTHASSRLKNLGDARYAPISMRQANRISVKNGRILRYVSDPQAIDIKHDEPTGSLFAVP